MMPKMHPVRKERGLLKKKNKSRTVKQPNKNLYFVDNPEIQELELIRKSKVTAPKTNQLDSYAEIRSIAPDAVLEKEEVQQTTTLDTVEPIQEHQMEDTAESKPEAIEETEEEAVSEEAVPEEPVIEEAIPEETVPVRDREELEEIIEEKGCRIPRSQSFIRMI